jgi:hypothetical protein
MTVHRNKTGMKQGKDKIGAPVYQLKVSLRELKPPIWRRVEKVRRRLSVDGVLQTPLP